MLKASLIVSAAVFALLGAPAASAAPAASVHPDLTGVWTSPFRVAAQGFPLRAGFFTGRYFPRSMYGQAEGALYAHHLLGGAIGPAVSGFLFDRTAGYRASLLLAAPLLTVSALLASRISRLYYTY